MDDKADPMNGWPVWEILHHLPSSLAKEDIYGKLYTYLRHVFKQFLDRLAATKVSFEMSCLDARQLKSQLGRDRYTRIEVCHVSLCYAMPYDDFMIITHLFPCRFPTSSMGFTSELRKHSEALRLYSNFPSVTRMQLSSPSSSTR